MLFHSLDFLIFILIVYPLYLVLPHKWQNFLLLVASYFFYGCWDWRFLPLIFVSTAVDYFCGLKIFASEHTRQRKFFLTVSLCSNLGLLAIFKYFNFFIDSFIVMLNSLGISAHPATLSIILPVGISFYTFQTLSYTIDIYRGELKPTSRFLDFALFVCFFPQLVAGPIERATNLLPQILNKRIISLDQIKQGCFLIFWGLFEKIFMASLLANIADPIFANNQSQSGSLVLIAVYAFAFQIFCDFDAYSNIARGLAKCFGIEIMNNFNIPYLSRNPREFWSRWHISLSTWLKDYLYIPLGGNKAGQWITIRNLLLTMLLGGLWHGAAWTFVLWGFYHGALLVGHRLMKNIVIPLPDWLKRLSFFHLVCLGWLFFRARSFAQIARMSTDLFSNWHITPDHGAILIRLIAICLPLWLIQSAQARSNNLLIILKLHWFTQTAIYAALTYLIIGWGILKPEEFIYFQF